ncbi:MAG: hypothetical protein ACI8PT_000263 [Gammaproteobacteria bacterium]|jgi:hypothetical protein
MTSSQRARRARRLNAKRYVFAVPNLHRSIQPLRAVGLCNWPDHPTHVDGWRRYEFSAFLERVGFQFIR